MSKKSTTESESLIEHYVASFEKLDDMVDMGLDDVAQQLAIGDPDEHGLALLASNEDRDGPLIFGPDLFQGTCPILAAL